MLNSIHSHLWSFSNGRKLIEFFWVLQRALKPHFYVCEKGSSSLHMPLVLSLPMISSFLKTEELGTALLVPQVWRLYLFSHPAVTDRYISVVSKPWQITTNWMSGWFKELKLTVVQEAGTLTSRCHPDHAPSRDFWSPSLPSFSWSLAILRFPIHASTFSQNFFSEYICAKSSFYFYYKDTTHWNKYLPYSRMT